MRKQSKSGLSELGSLMIEAMAMLALISMVTPILYKKAAERQGKSSPPFCCCFGRYITCKSIKDKVR